MDEKKKQGLIKKILEGLSPEEKRTIGLVARHMRQSRPSLEKSKTPCTSEPAQARR